MGGGGAEVGSILMEKGIFMAAPLLLQTWASQLNTSEFGVGNSFEEAELFLRA